MLILQKITLLKRIFFASIFLIADHCVPIADIYSIQVSFVPDQHFGPGYNKY